MEGTDIVVVNDDPTLLQLLQMALEDEGYRVMACDDADRGFRQIKATRPRLAILDVHMGRNGRRCEFLAMPFDVGELLVRVRRLTS
jgi:two-component system, OmpR family, response regulator